MRQAVHEQNHTRPAGRRTGNRTAAIAGLVLAGALTAAGCAIKTTPVSKPAVPVPAAWQQPAAQGAQATAPNLSRWWETLNDPTLSGLIDKALAANPDIRTAQSSVRQARLRRQLAARGLKPSVSGSIGGSGNKSRGIDAYDSYSAGVDASWEPDIWGGTKLSIEAYNQDIEASIESLRYTQVSLAAEVALSYTDLRSYQSRLAIAKANLARQVETLSLTTWRAQAGLATELEVEQSKTTVEQTRAQLPTYETGVAQAEHALAVLCGQPPVALQEQLAVAGRIPTVPDQVVTGIPADTMRQRPDVRRAERQLAAAHTRVDVARASLYPALTISGSFSLRGSSPLKLMKADQVVSSLAGNLGASLFDRGKLKDQIAIQSESEEQALIAYESALLGALQDVEDAMVSLANLRTRHASLENAAKSARNAASLARDQYTAGLTSYQTVIDTERTVLSAEDSLTSNEADGSSALIRLYKALGGGWDASATQTEARPRS
jgi:outer membrane protein, multidrug efflux system